MADLSWFLYSTGYLLVGIIVLVVSKKLFDLLTPYKVDIQLTEKDNPALGVLLSGYLMGMIAVIVGAFAGESAYDVPTVEIFVEEMIPIGTYGGLGMLCLFLSGIIGDKVILRKFSMRKEIIDNKNTAVAVVNGAFFIAAGLIVAGGIFGCKSIPSLLLAFAVGQAAIVLFCLVYQVATSYDEQDELSQKKNLAVGIAFGGNIIAFSMIVMKGLLLPQDAADWSRLERLHYIGYYVVAGCVLLVVARIINDRVFMPKARIADEIVKDQNINAGLLEACLAIAMGAILVFCL